MSRRSSRPVNWCSLGLGFLTQRRSVAERNLKEGAMRVTKQQMDENAISQIILDSAIAVHNGIGGPGLLESYYESALAQELRLRGLEVETQKNIPITYKGKVIGEPYRLDMLVEGKVIVECKATEKDNSIFASQVLTYLKMTGLHLGIVINFGKRRIIDGWKRVANDLPESSPRLCASASLR